MGVLKWFQVHLEGNPLLNHSFVEKNGGATIWEKNQGNPSLLFQQGRIFVKVMVLVLIKGKSPFGISIHPRDFGRNAIFTVNWGDKGRLTWNILRLILFYPTKRGEFGNPKLKEPNFPTDLFSVKLLLSNTSRPKSSKMSPTAATLCEE